MEDSSTLGRSDASARSLRLSRSSLVGRRGPSRAPHYGKRLMGSWLGGDDR